MRLILLVLAFLAVFVLLLWWGQERIVFQPPGPPWPDGDGARRVTYAADDGQPLFGYVVAPPRHGAAAGADSAGARPPAAAGVLIVFHGNADLAGWQVPWAREVAARTGWTVFLAEYRGYAGLGGAPSYTGTQRDARAAHAEVRRSLAGPAAPVALFGHSLGSAVAAELAAELAGRDGSPPAALILQSPLTSAAAMARLQLTGPLGLIWRLVGRVHWDTEARVRALPAPVWVVHGTGDRIVPVRMGRAVHAAARRPGELLLVQGAGHNDVVLAGGERYWRFLERALGEAGTGNREP